MRRALSFLELFAVALAFPVFATSYVVPPDRKMIVAAEAIVTGTVVDTYSRRAADGGIETVSRVVIDEPIKGRGLGESVDVVQWGGSLGDEHMVQSDAPRLQPGTEVLLFLAPNGRGEWTTWSLGLGAFELAEAGGDRVFRRVAEVFGWSEDGTPHLEQPRLGQPFADYVRGLVSGQECVADHRVIESSSPAVRAAGVTTHARFTGSGYSFPFGTTPARRRDAGLTVAWRPIGTQPSLDLDAAVDFSNGAWSGANSKIRFSRGPAATGDTKVGTDAEERIIANDPHNEIQGTFPATTSVVATAFSFCNGANCGQFTFNGDSFLAITHSDIVINDGVGANVGTSAFRIAIAHEMGHALGLRHSDGNGSGNAACASPLDCCFDTAAGGNCKAVMQAFLPNVAVLQAWDVRAITCLYGGTCEGGGGRARRRAVAHP